MSSTFLDCCIAVFTFLWALSSMGCGLAAPPIALLLYYGIFDVAWGRTPGKFLIRSNYVCDGTTGAPRWKLVFRAILRPFLGPLSLLSWKRVTLLDLLTGLRVDSVHYEPRINREEIFKRSIR